MLAMEAGTTRASRQPALSLTSIASMLAPTGRLGSQQNLRLHLEPRHRLMQVAGHLRQFLASAVGVLGAEQDLLGEAADAHQVAVHFPSHQRLLFGGTGNHHVALVDL
ncbi:hypothetical protein D3C73_797500 [compost metagenome]